MSFAPRGGPPPPRPPPLKKKKNPPSTYAGLLTLAGESSDHHPWAKTDQKVAQKTALPAPTLRAPPSS